MNSTATCGSSHLLHKAPDPQKIKTKAEKRCGKENNRRVITKKSSAASRGTYQRLPRRGVLGRRAGTSLWSRKRVSSHCHPMDTNRNTICKAPASSILGRNIGLGYRQQFCGGLKTKRSEPWKKVLFPHLKQGNYQNPQN